jgi:K+/H+ antiporter YhaU regulatory subunit KhtT
MSAFRKVEGHQSLVRDMSSHAIIATSDNEYNEYRKRRDAQKRQLEMVNKQAEEIQSLKNDMQEIKQLLKQLVKGE